MADNTAQEDTKARSMNFVEEEVWNDLQAGRNGGRINTRFPPEPNGYLTSAMRKRSAWISASQNALEALATCVSTTQIQ